MHRPEASAIIQEVTEAFDEHDLDAIIARFADDAVFESPPGPHPVGRRLEASAAIRAAFAARFAGIPDVCYRDFGHLVDGDRASSEWTRSGTSSDGERIEVRGCDLWTFRDDKMVRKDSFWKIGTRPST